MELNISHKGNIDNLKEANLITSLRHIASEVRRSMVIEFCGEDDMAGECEQASIIMWKYINDIKLVEPNQNKVVLGEFNGNGHIWNIVNGIYVDITVDQFGDYKWGVISNSDKYRYTIQKYMDYTKESSLLETTDDFLAHII